MAWMVLCQELSPRGKRDRPLTKSLNLLKSSHLHGMVAFFMGRSTAMDMALWIIAIVAILYLVVRLGLAWMVPDHYRGK
jgi:hypothetical protein